MRTGHKPAKANQKQAWLRTPMMNIGVDLITLAQEHKKTLTESEQKDRRLLVYSLFDHRLDQSMVN